MTISMVQLGAGFSTTSPASANSLTNSGGTFAFVSGKWYMAAYAAGSASTSLTNPTLAGATSGSWTRKGPASFDTVASPTDRSGYFYFKATSSFSESPSMDWATNTPTSLAVVICECNSDPAGAFFVQSQAGTGDTGTTATNGTPLSAFADANNGTLLVVGTTATGAITAGTGVDQVATMSETVPNIRIWVGFRAGQTLSPTATFASANWGAQTAEITKDASTAALISQIERNHRGVGRGLFRGV